MPASWLWKYYTYRVRVYDVWTQQIQTFETTDPYSYSLAADGARTQVMLNREDTPIMLALSWSRSQRFRFQLELVPLYTVCFQLCGPLQHCIACCQHIISGMHCMPLLDLLLAMPSTS